MLKFKRHVLLPAMMPLLFMIIAATPVETLGCRNRGLLALSVSLSSGVAGVGTAVMALKTAIHKDPTTRWWFISTLILTIPVIAMIILA